MIQIKKIKQKNTGNFGISVGDFITTIDLASTVIMPCVAE
jgi:hypothetical protein